MVESYGNVPRRPRPGRLRLLLAVFALLALVLASVGPGSALADGRRNRESQTDSRTTTFTNVGEAGRDGRIVGGTSVPNGKD